jgi:hypothetical protein
MEEQANTGDWSANAMELPPHAQFFGSLVSVSVELDVLREYILHMDQSIEEAEAACQTSVQAVPPSLQSIAEDKSDLLAEPFPRLLHTGVIISTVILLEQELTFFARFLQKVEGLGLSLGDLRGSLVERFKKYCLHVARLPFPVSERNWQDLRGVIEIRNCLVHNEGFLDGFNKACAVRAFMDDHGTPLVEDGRLCVGADTSLKVLDVVKLFIESIHNEALQKYPDDKGGSKE